ncbi:protein kinase [Clostridioides difficile]|uniref:protein kinase domain-containing protein n=1 Tax=Clostridioides difficile TaxID=1496 RepID=UPI001E3A8E7C|nr:protein kinase [Clostridioides difficile]MCA0825057.1 protein kinase [Clostridioides difficile]MCB4258371.1 protein kinase [Clostridioides difficile]MCC8871417.1 protein kinase [Clostridioides difficile]MCE0626306.1 protein kinase [Clostridioides difficile]MCE0641364.1 protein kinase [Clostridioides difficile]
MTWLNFIGNRYEVVNSDDVLEINKIYKARDVFYRKNVLIKVIKHNNYICEDFVSNLIDESTALDEINSPYILKIIDVGIHCTEETTLYYVVSEDFNGIGLDELILGNYLHLEAIVNIMIQVLKALEMIHRNHSYHGSLKSSSIIVDTEYNIKICDFGITKANNGVNTRSYGNRRYLCPHQLCINYTDKESDFFATGLILFESIFKKLPFGESNSEEKMLQSIDKGLDWNSIKAINGNTELINVIKRLLGRNNKYTRANDIIIDLSKVMYEKAYIEVEDEKEEEQKQDKVIQVKKEYKSKMRKKIHKKLVVAGLAIVMISMIIISSII